jgi:alkylation response protein AidB-like acyl-CoA dehydrogenase
MSRAAFARFRGIAGQVPCLGMDLTYPPEAEEFRAVISTWLAENLPVGWGSPDFSLTPEERIAFNEQWTSKLFAGGWICASWPVEYGGKGLTLLQQVVLNEEFARAGAPLRGDFFGDTLVGPTLLQWGTEEQKKQFIPGILRGEIAWCQGFSEPDAGSDLAGLKTRAELDGDEWVINGQKVWTTQAQYADYIFLLARTDPEAPKHAGISYLLVPMDQAGVEVRPIQQIDGSAEFNEVFLTNVRCPKDNVIGGVNNGWKVAMTTLGFERGTSATTGHRRFLKEFNDILELARERGVHQDPLFRQRLARSWSKIKIMQINGYRTLTDALHGTHATAALAACNKMFWSEAHQETMLLAMDILGMEGQTLLGQEGQDTLLPGARKAWANYPVNNLQSLFFFSRSETIWGGAAEIQRNIVGERVLGLPKEPRP